MFQSAVRVDVVGHTDLHESPVRHIVEAARVDVYMDVDVALVVVEFNAVKFCSVVEPVARRFDSVVSPPVAVNVPVNDADDDIVCPLIRPDVIGPTARVPNDADVA